MLELNQLYLMDCMEGMKGYSDATFDLIITDPPYNVHYNEKSTHLAKHGKARDKQISRDKHFKDVFNDYSGFCKELYRLTKQMAHVYLFCAEKQIPEWFLNMENAGFKFNNIIICAKNKQSLDMTYGLKYSYKTEICLFYRKGNKKLNFLGESNLMNCPTGTSLIHPTEKPISLIRYFMRQSANPGDVVLDPFMGSGTTAVAALDEHLDFGGFEISPEYYKIANKRIEVHKKRPKPFFTDKKLAVRAPKQKGFFDK